MNDRELKLFESNCVKIGYAMCQAESLTALRDMIKDCKSKEELNILKQAKDKILSLQCVWNRQDN